MSQANIVTDAIRTTSHLVFSTSAPYIPSRRNCAAKSMRTSSRRPNSSARRATAAHSSHGSWHPRNYSSSAATMSLQSLVKIGRLKPH